jgi:ferric iron reductase protein FhuF
LNESKLHQEIKKTVSNLMNEQDINLDKAISQLFKKYKHEFEELLKADDDYHYKDETVQNSEVKNV